jgi:putative hydrolase of the HAD superfamily
MISAVLFDLDGTLYDRDLLVGRIAREQFACFQTELAGIEQQRFVERVLDLDAHGWGNKPELYQRVVRDWRLAPEMAVRLEQHFWDCYDRGCTLSEDVFRTLCTLRAHDKKLGVISNGATNRQMCKLTALGLSWCFDAVLISEAEDLRKPDPKIFARALERCGVAAENAVFVGDYPDADIVGARAAGMIPVWKRVPYWSMPFEDVLAVDQLSDILPLCLAH